MLQDQLIKEIKQIPDDKLVELYDLIHYFRLGLLHETQLRKETRERPAGPAKEVTATTWLARWKRTLLGKDTPAEGDERVAHLLRKHLR